MRQGVIISPKAPAWKRDEPELMAGLESSVGKG